MSNKTQTPTAQPISELRELSNNELRILAPAMFGTEAAEDVSDKYTFVNTSRVLPILRDSGFVPISARQRLSAGVTGLHRVDLFHREHLNKMRAGKMDSIPRIILENSHDRTRRLIIMAGYFRLVCSNGMVASSGANAQLVTRHVNLDTKVVQSLVGGMANMLDKLQAVVDQMRDRKLTPIERSMFAKFAVEARYKGYAHVPINGSSVLVARRDEDKGDDLWTVFSRIQENVIKGGVETITGRHSRGVKSFTQDVVVNKRLWAGAEALLTGGSHGLQKLRKEIAPSE